MGDLAYDPAQHPGKAVTESLREIKSQPTFLLRRARIRPPVRAKSSGRCRRRPRLEEETVAAVRRDQRLLILPPPPPPPPPFIQTTFRAGRRRDPRCRRPPRPAPQYRTGAAVASARRGGGERGSDGSCHEARLVESRPLLQVRAGATSRRQRRAGFAAAGGGGGGGGAHTAHAPPAVLEGADVGGPGRASGQRAAGFDRRRNERDRGREGERERGREKERKRVGRGLGPLSALAAGRTCCIARTRCAGLAPRCRH